jgi:ATP-dependent Clp protease ATP-binding subunit ClpC
MYDRFSAAARSGVARGEAEAFARGASQVEPEDVLVALAGLDGVAGSVLRAVAADAAVLRAGVAAVAAPTAGDAERARPLALSHATAAAFSIAAREADGLRIAWVGTEHLLLGLLREPTGRATALLTAVRRDPGMVRERILDLVSSPGFVSPEAPGHSAHEAARRVAAAEAAHAAAADERADEAARADHASGVEAAGAGVPAGDAELLRTLVVEVGRLRTELRAVHAEVAALREELGRIVPRAGRHIA